MHFNVIKRPREAAKFIGGLMTEYGLIPSSGDGSESLIIGDTQEAWVFEVMGVGPGWTVDSGKPGAIWAAQRLPDDHATMIPNYSIIKQIDPEDSANFMVSGELPAGSHRPRFLRPGFRGSLSSGRTLMRH